MRILAVDDEPYILELMPMLATRIGFPDMTTANSAHAALELIAQSQCDFDCLIFDINMPGMDGIELCRKVRAIERYRRTPIIMLTAMSEREFVDSAFQAGATDYTTKPFDMSDLAARLRVAQELVLARREVETARSPSEVAVPVAGQRAGFADGGILHGASNIADLDALVNYLLQLSRAGFSVSQMLGIVIDRADLFHESATDEDFRQALCNLGDAVNSVAVRNLGLLAYAGRGAFVVVPNTGNRVESDVTETAVQRALDERQTKSAKGRSMRIEVSVGNPIVPLTGHRDEILKSVERAIDDAVARSAAAAKPRRAVRAP